MKPADQRFIELVNLFVDNEISTDETRELELAMEGNSKRQKIYGDYCQMRKACDLLVEQVEVPVAAEQFQRRLFLRSTGAEGSGRSRRLAVVWSGIGAMAAACVAVFFALQNNVVVVDTPDCIFSLASSSVETPTGIFGHKQVRASFHRESNGTLLGMQWNDADLGVDLNSLKAGMGLGMGRNLALEAPEVLSEKWDGNLEDLNSPLMKPAAEMSAFSIGN